MLNQKVIKTDNICSKTVVGCTLDLFYFYYNHVISIKYNYLTIKRTKAQHEATRCSPHQNL